MKLKASLQFFGILAVILALMPFVAMDYWWIRIFDFPHTQLTILTFVAFLTYFFRFDMRSWRDYLFAVILLGTFLFQLQRIFPYTPFSREEIKNSETATPKDTLSILIANVLQKNNHLHKLVSEIQRASPNVIVLTETNKKWSEGLSPELDPEYPYKVEIPLENTYGMILFSQYRLINPEVKFLVADSIPSIHTKLEMPSKQLIRLISIHPTPPMPQHNPSSADRDSEMMLAAQMARESELPVILTGDFNDVAWSQTTSLFQEVSGLLDPRIGRGFYNTYNANSWIMRWPLDHLFVSEEFRLLDLQKGRDIESDHFPLFARFNLEKEKAHEQRRKPATPEELNRAKEQIKE